MEDASKLLNSAGNVPRSGCHWSWVIGTALDTIVVGQAGDGFQQVEWMQSTSFADHESLAVQFQALPSVPQNSPESVSLKRADAA